MENDQVAFFRSALKQARTVYDTERDELSSIESRAYWLKEDLAKLKRTITALAAMCSESPFSDPIGITDSVKEVMEIEELEVTTQEVVSKIENMGFDLSSQKNPAASVHAILTRMAEDGEIEKVANEEDNKKISWRGPHYDPDAIPF
jgi:hypothetical protein